MIPLRGFFVEVTGGQARCEVPIFFSKSLVVLNIILKFATSNRRIYVTTGVVISSLFKDVSDSSTIYVIGTVVAVSTLVVGLVLTNKKKKKEE